MGFAFSFLIKGDYQNEFEKPLDLYVNVLVYISNTKKKKRSRMLINTFT